MEEKKRAISIIALGKLGLCMAACFAYKGHRVIGVDINPHTIQAVNEGRSPIYEPRLAELLRESQGRLTATNDYKYAIENSDVTFIIVPTPSDEKGGFSTKYVEVALKSIATVLKSKGAFHIVVLTSTVLPGVTEGIVKPLIEKVSGKKCGTDFGLCYSPEFIALGTIIRDYLNPDMVLIGESDPRSGESLAEIYRTLCDNKPHIARMTLHNAELTKISFNAFITMKITFANTLAEICERMPSGNVDMITRALGFESRIGPECLKGGFSYGGPCFPRDNKAFAFFAKRIGCKARLSEATDKENKHQTERIIELVKQRITEVKDKSIAILGLTYKIDTDVIEESAAIKIASTLLQDGARLSVYDPAGMENSRLILGEKNIRYANSARDCLQDADLCILATPWDEFTSLKPEDFTTTMKQPVLLDCWRIFDQSEFSRKMEYLTIGLYGLGQV